MSLSRGFRRAFEGVGLGSMALGTLLLVISFAVFFAGIAGWTSIEPSIAVVQSAGWMVIFGLVLNRAPNERLFVEKR